MQNSRAIAKEQIKKALAVHNSPAQRVSLLEARAAIEPDDLTVQLRLGRARYRNNQTGTFEDHLNHCLTLAEQLPLEDNFPTEELLWSVHFSPDSSLLHKRLSQLQTAVENRRRICKNTIELSVGLCRVLLARRDRQAFIRAVADLPLSQSGQEPLKSREIKSQIRLLKDIATRWAAPEYPDYTTTKVFGIGLSRTGTSSLHSALDQLGLTGIHWQNALTRDLIQQHDYFLYDAFSDVGITAQFEMLFTMFPNARFVWTTRAFEDWQYSVHRHYKKNIGINSPNELIKPPVSDSFRGLKGQIEASNYGHHASWHDAYSAHTKRVEHFFADKHPSKLLRISITDGDGWEPLCKFLGYPVPQTPFPHKNVAPPKSKHT